MNEEEFVSRAAESFPFFVENVFSASFHPFTSGAYVRRVAEFYQGSKRTMRISARDHFKSTGLYALIMHEFLQAPEDDVRIHYFSYEKSMAQYHIGKIRELVNRNPLFQGLVNLKTTAEGVAKYTWNNGVDFSIHPHGLMSFKRGIHDKLVIVDDPFQDPASKLDPKIITRINLIFKTQMLDMPLKGGALHVVGTPQTTVDFFFDEELRKQFKVLITPAIESEPDKRALWPEWMDWDELMKRRAARGSKIFEQEYNCRPAYSEEAFFRREQLLRCIDANLFNQYEAAKDDKLDRFGGWDVGKKQHPAHFTVLEQGEDGIVRQKYQRWFDGVDYIQQLKEIKAVVERLKVDRVYYDATRGELESLKEQGELPGEYKGINFTLKQKHAMAGGLDALVSRKGPGGEPNPGIRLQPNERQLAQLQVVTNDLDAIETPEGHGDCFWSLALACWGFASAPRIGVLEGIDPMPGRKGWSVLEWGPRF